MLIFERFLSGPAMQAQGGRLNDPNAARYVDLLYRP